MTKLEATVKVNRLLISYNHDDFAKKLGISKPTLYARLAKHNWKLGELSLIEKLN